MYSLVFLYLRNIDCYIHISPALQLSTIKLFSSLSRFVFVYTFLITTIEAQPNRGCPLFHMVTTPVDRVIVVATKFTHLLHVDFFRISAELNNKKKKKDRNVSSVTNCATNMTQVLTLFVCLFVYVKFNRSSVCLSFELWTA